MDEKDPVSATYQDFRKGAVLKHPLSEALAETELVCDKGGRHLHGSETSKEQKLVYF